MQVAIGSDHAGFHLKGLIVAELSRKALEVLDLGTYTEETTDYPAYCIAVAKAVADHKVSWGIVIGGSGQGEQIAANKVLGVRAALCNDPYYAKLARRDNDANVLAIGSRVVAAEFAFEILDVWIATKFEGGRHKRRMDLISNFERDR